MAAEVKIARPIFGGCADAMTAPIPGAGKLKDDSAARSVILPDSSVILPDSSVILPDSSVILPDRSKLRLDKSVMLPDRSKLRLDKSVMLPDRSVMLPDRSVMLPDRLTLAAFGVLVLVLGSGSLVVRYTYQEIAPFWGGFLRFAFAAVVFWGIVVARRIPRPRGRALRGAALFGALNVGLSFIFILWGLVETPASVYALIAATVPLLTLFFAAAHKVECVYPRGLAGSTLAAVGIAAIMGTSLSAGAQLSPPHLVAILLGAVCMAESGVIAKLIPESHPIAINAISMTISAPMLLAASWLVGENRALPSTPQVWLALGWLAVGGAVLGFGLYLFVVSRWTASGASYSFVLSPVATIILAAGLAGEPVTWPFVIGGGLVLFGVWMGAMSGKRG